MPMATPHEQRKYQREWIAKRRQEWIDSQGNVCAKCGFDKDLQIDHKDPTIKTTHRIWSRCKEFRDTELSKCQLLCKACHDIKTHSSDKEYIVSKQKRGMAHPNVKLTETKVLEIRNLWSLKEHSQLDLAKLYNVSRQTIEGVVNRRVWKHI